MGAKISSARQPPRYGQGDNSLFALRSRELAAIAGADKTIDENVTIQRSLDRAVALLVGDAEKSMQSGSEKLIEDLSRNRMLLLIVAAISILVAYPLAYILAYRIPARWQRIALVLTVLPFWTSYVLSLIHI